MPTQRFDISILLNVLTENVKEIDKIGEAFEDTAANALRVGRILQNVFDDLIKQTDGSAKSIINLKAAIKDAGEQAAGSFGKLFRNIGGVDSLNDIINKVDDLRKNASKGISLDIKTDLRELELYIQRLTEIRRLAERTDNAELFENITNVLENAKDLRNVLLQTEKISLDKNISSYNVLLDEANAKLKENYKSAELLSKTGLNPQALEAYVKGLENARDTFKILSDEAQKLGLSTRTLDTTIENLTGKINQFRSAKPAKIGTIEGLEEITKQLTSLENKARSGLTVNFEINRAKANLDILEKDLIQLQKEAATTGNTELLNQAIDARTQLQGTRQELERIAKIPLSEEVQLLKYEVGVVTDRLKQLQKEGKDLIDTGADVATVRRLINQIESAQQELIVLRNTSQSLGRDTTQINIRIRQGEETLKLLRDIDAEAVNIKRDEIDLKVKNKADLQAAIQQLKELNKELEQATADRDFKAVGRIKRQADELRSLQSQIAPKIQNTGNRQAIEVFSGFTQGLGAAEDRLKAFEQQAGTGLVRGFNNARTAFNTFTKESGGSNAAFRALAGTFRLIGTSAFVVGGELRTLGFAFSAVGTIIQNFAPLALTLATSLGLVAIPVIALTGYLAALAIEGITVIAVLAAIAKTGLKFNDEFSRTANSVAGVVTLFFDVTRQGKQVGEGLDSISAAQAKLAAATTLVKRELRALSFEALTTEFTTSELFPAFNSVAKSASTLAPDLKTLRDLTGGLARISSVAGVSAANLGSSIVQILRGTGRVTNPLQAFFNNIRDSEGIELTAKRITKLRKEGTLLGEIFRVTNQFGALGEEQAKTLTGSFSNLVEVFEQFAGFATEKAYDRLRLGFVSIQKLVTQEVTRVVTDSQGVAQKLADGTVATVKSLEFTEPIKRLQNLLNELFDRISADFISLLGKLANYILDFGKYLEQNDTLLIDIYESLKSIAITFIEILSDVASLVRTVTMANSNIEAMKSILIEVSLTLIDTRAVFIDIEKTILYIGLAIEGFLVKPTNRWLDGLTLGYFKLEEASQNTINTITKNIADADKQLDELKNRALDLKIARDASPEARLFFDYNKDTDPKERNKSILDGIDLFKKAFKASQEDDKKAKKGAKDRAVSVLNEGKQLAEAQISLAKTTEDVQLNLIQDRLKRQQDLIQAQLDANIIAQSSATAKILSLKQAEFDADQTAKLNDIQRAKERQKLLEQEFIRQEALIRKQNTGKRALSSKLEEVNLTRQISRLKYAEEIVKTEGEIALIKQKQLDLQLDAVKAQLSLRESLIKTNIDLKQSLADLGDRTSAESLSATQRKIVQEQAEQVRQLERAYNDISTLDFANLAFTGGGVGKAFRETKALLGDNLKLLKEQLNVRLQLARFEFTQSVIQTRQNELRLQEDVIQQNLITGSITEYEAAVQTQVARLKTVKALKLANEELKKNKDLTAAQKLAIEENNLTIRKLAEQLPDSGILDVTRSISDSFTTLFERLQEDIGDAKNSFKDLVNSILGSFRRLVAQRLSEALFEQLLKPQGKVGKLLETLGLSRQAKINEDAARQAAVGTNDALKQTQDSLKEAPQTADQILQQVNEDFLNKTEIFRNALKFLTDKINMAATELGFFNPNQAKVQAEQAQNVNVLSQIVSQGIDSNLKQAQMIVELQAIRALLSSNASTSASYDLTNLIPNELNRGGSVGKLQYFAKGGGAKGADVIPAYLSNGEFVFSPEMVKMVGLPVLEYLNKFGKLPSFASGGLFENFGAGRSGASNFSGYNFFGGGASLIKKPDPIVEKVAKTAKKKGGLRNILGNILSFAAPFLNFIPVIGPLLSLGAGATGGALTGSNKGVLGGILGGVFGGLSNLGGFTGKGGFLGNLAGKVGSNTGQLGLSLFGGLLGNGGGTLGKLFAPKSVGGVGGLGKLTEIFGKAKGGLGNLINSIFKGGFSKKFSDLFKLFGVNSGYGFKRGGIVPRLAGGGQPDLSKLLGLFTAFTSLSGLFSGGGQSSDYTEEIIDDPDAARKNLFGSAYSSLVDSGKIPEFKYSAETLQKLKNQINGIKNLVKIPRQSFLSKLFGVLPSLAGLFNAFGGSSLSKVGKASTSVKDAVNASGFAGGGFVKGAGTGTSDSILSFLRPESFVLKAKSAAELRDNILASITDNIVGFNTGGLVEMIPELINNEVSTSANVSIHNYTDIESAMLGFLASPKGQKAMLNNVNKGRNAYSGIISRGRGNRI